MFWQCLQNKTTHDNTSNKMWASKRQHNQWFVIIKVQLIPGAVTTIWSLSTRTSDGLIYITYSSATSFYWWSSLKLTAYKIFLYICTDGIRLTEKVRRSIYFEFRIVFSGAQAGFDSAKRATGIDSINRPLYDKSKGSDVTLFDLYLLRVGLSQIQWP